VAERTDCDVVIIGAGIIGLSVARALRRSDSSISVTVVDKEDTVAAHQSSHNSGVIHSGLYYKPGSLKARLSAEGRRDLYRLCSAAGIPAKRTGKLVVATKETELGALAELERRGLANGLRLKRVDLGEMRNLEPEVAGISGLFVPEAGVVDFPSVAAYIADELRASGVRLETSWQVSGIEERAGSVAVGGGSKELKSRILINCAGLHSDRVAALSGLDPTVKIIPFRGEYYRLSDTAASLIRGLVYPVPDPRFPFLGVHFTRGIDGVVEVGPNAVLGLGREHYRGTQPNWGDLWETLKYSGFLRLAARHWRSGASELVHSRVKGLYARLARNLIPAVRKEDLLEGGAGVRAQAVDRTGRLVDDFVIERSGSMFHVLNAPSPGATASLAIGAHIAREAQELLNA